jgi:hypothetical protein
MWMRYACTSPSGGTVRTCRVFSSGSSFCMLWLTRRT